MVLTVPQAHDLGREHGHTRATLTYSPTLPYAAIAALGRTETRRALLWMAAHAPFPSYMHKDTYAREFFEEFYRYWQRQRTTETRNLRRQIAASVFH